MISGTPTTAGTYGTTVTVTDSTGAAGTASFTWTVSPSGGGGCTAAQLLGHRGFESGSTTWTATSVITDDSGESAHSGSYYAWLDGYGSAHTDTLSQPVTIPSGCKPTRPRCFLHLHLGRAPDRRPWRRTRTSTPPPGTRRSPSTRSSPAGSTATLTFSGVEVEDSSLQTSFVVDDTALTTG